MAKRSSCDFLSDLPLGIIHMILALVPIKDAVKTSILSRKWRYKWASLPELVFRGNCLSTLEDQTRVKHIIHQTLLLHEGPIQKFKLFMRTMKRCSYTDQWLVFLSRKEIRMLTLFVVDGRKSAFQVHSGLYHCQNLTHLELIGCAIPLPPPTFKGFLCLTRLFLQHVVMSSDMIESLVANSPLLEELALSCSYVEPFQGHNLRIHAPNLKHFYFLGVCLELCLYAPLLTKLRVHNDSIINDKHLQQKNPVCNYTKVLGGLTNLEEFSGNDSFVKYLSIGIESCQRSLVFHHLRLVEICPMSIYDVELIPVVVRLITGAPNLHKLVISCFYAVEWSPKATSISSCDSGFAPNFTFGRLKLIEMSWISGGLHWMRLIKFLLESSPVMETMIVEPDPACCTAEQRMNMMAELLTYRRASTNAQILFRTS